MTRSHISGGTCGVVHGWPGVVRALIVDMDGPGVVLGTTVGLGVVVTWHVIGHRSSLKHCIGYSVGSGVLVDVWKEKHHVRAAYVQYRTTPPAAFLTVAPTLIPFHVLTPSVPG